MFKSLIILGSILGTFAAPGTSDGVYRAQLMLEFKDFIVAIPVQKMYATLLDHLNNDVEMQAALKYVQGKDFKQSVRTLLSRPSTKELRLRYIEAGLDIDRYEKMFNDVIAGLKFDVAEDTKRSFGKYLAELDQLIPYEKLINILNDKLENRPIFIRFFNTITSDEMHMLFEKTMHSAEFKNVAQELEDMDVAVYQILDVLFEIFGWKKHAQPNDL